MAPLEGFSSKFLKRLNKVDQASLEQYCLTLINEKETAYAALQALSDAVLILDTQGMVRFVNAAAQHLFMRSLFEHTMPIGKVCEDRELCLTIEHAIAESKLLLNIPVTMIQPRLKKLLLSVAPLYTSTFPTNATSFLVVVHDLSDVRMTGTDNTRSETIETLTKLAAGVAHEIGNPLNTINIYLKLIAQALKNNARTKAEELLTVIAEETKRLDKVVKDFLAVTRGKVAILKKADINHTIESALHFLKPELDIRHIDVVVELERSIPSFYFDANKIREALLNIFKNALEAMPRGGTLTVTTALKGKVVTMFCKDTGVGINEDDLPHIFDAFYTTKREGSGLGLMNVYNIIQAHHGRIHVESQAGEGTLVVVTLPLQREKLQLPFMTTAKQSKRPGKE